MSFVGINLTHIMHSHGWELVALAIVSLRGPIHGHFGGYTFHWLAARDLWGSGNLLSVLWVRGTPLLTSPGGRGRRR